MTVVAFPGDDNPMTPDERQAEVVERIEGLLAKAKSGELLSIAYAYVRSDRLPTIGTVGEEATRTEIAAAVSDLHFDILLYRNSMLKEAVPV